MSTIKISIRRKFLFVGTLAVLLFAVVLAGCSAEQNSAGTQDKTQYTTLDQLSGKTFAGLVGSVSDQFVSQRIENAKYSYFNTAADQVAALSNGKVDAVALDEPIALYAASKNPNFSILEEPLAQIAYVVALQKNSPLTEEVNAAIATLKADGTLTTMADKWLSADKSVKTMPQIANSGANGTLRVSHDITTEPLSYLGPDGTATGYDLELMLRIGALLERRVEFIPVDFSGVMPMLQAGKADAAIGGFSITEERKKAVDLSDPYYEGGIHVLVLSQTATSESLWDSLVSGFTVTFLTNNRWHLILDGLKVTLLISLCSGALGLAIGFGVCMLRRSRSRLASAPIAALIRMIQGIPITVLLMILYYIIFKTIDLPGIVVAICAFALNFAVYSGEMMRSGLDTVDSGQMEAAYALGFNKYQAFWKVAFPQAARHFLPLLRTEFISLVKSTSVVGFIAVQDLTKVGDIIRGSTLEAFFPLISMAVIYFLIANLLAVLLGRVEIRLDPKQRKIALKGVVIK